MAFQVQHLLRILRLLGVVGPGWCYQRDRGADATIKANSISNNVAHFVEHDGPRDDDAATPETFDRSNKYKRGSARPHAGLSSHPFQADAEVDPASGAQEDSQMLRRSSSDPARTSSRDTTDVRTGLHSPSPFSSLSSSTHAAQSFSFETGGKGKEDSDAAQEEHQHQHQLAAVGIAGPDPHARDRDSAMAANAGSSGSASVEAGIRGSESSKSTPHQPVRTSSSEDVILQEHEQRKGPGETGMFGKYATHTDTTTTAARSSSARISPAPAPRLAPDSQMLRRGGGTKHSKRSTSTAQEVSPSSGSGTSEETRRYVRRDHHDQPVSSAGVLAGLVSSEKAKQGDPWYSSSYDYNYLYGGYGDYGRRLQRLQRLQQLQLRRLRRLGRLGR